MLFLIFVLFKAALLPQAFFCVYVCVCVCVCVCVRAMYRDGKHERRERELTAFSCLRICFETH